MRTLQRRAPLIPARPEGAKGRPVLLATLDVPFDQAAVVFAIDSAVELGQRLIVANFVERAPLPLSAMLGYDDLPYPLTWPSRCGRRRSWPVRSASTSPGSG